MSAAATGFAAARARTATRIKTLGPGLALALVVALLGVVLAPLVGLLVPIPAMVLALLVGMALSSLGARPVCKDGLDFAVRTVLRWAVALLGLRIALGDIWALGAATAGLVIVAMAVTLVAGVLCARALGKDDALGALAGAATAVCGASAALATATVLPRYEGRQGDIIFVVIAVNALSTLAMLLYPPIGHLLGFDPQALGILLGATIHDVAQVVGAGYAISDETGNAAVVVKLFRVFLLLPVVLAIGWWFALAGRAHGAAEVPVPMFALVFLALCVVNSLIPALPALDAAYQPLRSALVEASTWGLLIAIGALGLGTSARAVARIGWRHLVLVTTTTLVILGVAVVGLAMLS